MFSKIKCYRWVQKLTLTENANITLYAIIWQHWNSTQWIFSLFTQKYIYFLYPILSTYKAFFHIKLCCTFYVLVYLCVLIKYFSLRTILFYEFLVILLQIKNSNIYFPENSLLIPFKVSCKTSSPDKFPSEGLKLM